MALNGIRREKAALALARGLSVKLAAEEAGVGLRTLHRWLADDSAFQQRVDQLGNELFLQAARRLSDWTGEAARALSELLSSKQEKIRLQAIRTVFEVAADLRQIKQLSERVAALERSSPLEHDP
jgi:hypothetical protein